ncbi:hypothetical protein [Pantoea cypripedii]|nr:hypothetical protein [Pantoea cypripedii]
MMNGLTVRDEPGHYYSFRSPLPHGEFFEIRPRFMPDGAKPIVDDETGMCIGYSVSQAPGLWQVYDSDGHFVALEESPLESPLLDPTDLILLAAGAFRIFLAGRAVLQSGARKGITVNLSHSILGLLRGRLKIGLSPRSLKMTDTVARHMKDPSRFVPIQIQEKAIRYGRRMTDPMNEPGLFRYETKMYRLVEDKQNKGSFFHKPYRLEVLVREKDWTIMHFQYMP